MNNYYNINAKHFFDETVNADMSAHYAAFLEKLPKGAHILDAGCGSGRDSLHFKKLGYKITAMDISTELCKLASEYIGQQVLELSFQEMAFEEDFEGIWACASLLHVPRIELPAIIEKLKKALKVDGILFATFKYGNFERERNGRYFCDLTEQKAESIFTDLGFKVEKMWITGDVRPERNDELWINVLVKNIGIIT